MEYKTRDLLEVTAHFACRIGEHWDELYNGNLEETVLLAVDWAKEFLGQYDEDMHENWLEPIELFFEAKLKQVKERFENEYNVGE